MRPTTSTSPSELDSTLTMKKNTTTPTTTAMDMVKWPQASTPSISPLIGTPQSNDPHRMQARPSTISPSSSPSLFSTHTTATSASTSPLSRFLTYSSTTTTATTTAQSPSNRNRNLSLGASRTSAQERGETALPAPYEELRPLPPAVTMPPPSKPNQARASSWAALAPSSARQPFTYWSRTLFSSAFLFW